MRVEGTAADGGIVGDSVSRTVQVLGPGDIIGINSRSILRSEPKPGTTDFEPNYLAHIEFYEEDFPWRYSAMRSTDRITPWITLLVLKEGPGEGKEFETVPTGGGPLPAIRVTNRAALPRADELWAWAHVQVNQSLGSGEFRSENSGSLTNEVGRLLERNPDLGYSRLLSPRRLNPGTAYRAFLVPTFEVGRLAGLGQTVPDNANGAQISWEGSDAILPVYFGWSFQTGKPGDFEHLVRLLRPVQPDPKLGVRPMQVRLDADHPPRDFDLTLMLGGALRVPVREGAPHPDDWDVPYPHPLQTALAERVNLADDYEAIGSADPVITPPLIGRWHALTRRLLKTRAMADAPNRENWVHELNLDPRFRVPAGIGTRVVQENQEDWMRSAWQQLGDVLEANRRIRLAQLAREVAVVWHRRHLQTLQAGSVDRAFLMTAPVHRRVVAENATVQHRTEESFLSAAATSAAFRRVTRPRGRLMRGLAFTDDVRADNLLTRMSQGLVQAARPKRPLSGEMTIEEIARRPGFEFLSFQSQTRKVCSEFPHGDAPIQVPPSPRGSEQPDGDPAETDRFHEALCEVSETILICYESDKSHPPTSVDIPAAAGAVIQAIDPAKTIPDRIGRIVFLPPQVAGELSPRFQEAMAYPRIDRPMYEPLTQISSELFLPNIQLVEPNSVTALETNPKFIESYMAGLNHEFGRELLWREYPTDQRGSCFRQFWRAASQLDAEADPDKRREKLYDIPPLHTWPPSSKLGQHNQRAAPAGGANPADKNSQLVLVVRGELLKRYPNTVIYAQRADWVRNAGVPDKKQQRIFHPSMEIRTPLYEAQVLPDIYFFGFGLTAAEARGEVAEGQENAGWFIIFKERPGEPRFGLDESGSGRLVTVNDLWWGAPNMTAGQFLSAAGLGAVSLPAAVSGGADEDAQRGEDLKVLNSAPSRSNSARCAYCLLQTPVMVAVHSSEIVPKSR